MVRRQKINSKYSLRGIVKGALAVRVDEYRGYRMCWKMLLLLECVAGSPHHRNIFSHSDLALRTDPCIGLGETRGRGSGNSTDIGIRRLVRILAHTYGDGQVSQTHGTSVVTAVKGDTAFMSPLNYCVALMK